MQGNDITVHCADFQSDWASEIDVMDEYDFMRFQFKINFAGISFIA